MCGCYDYTEHILDKECEGRIVGGRETFAQSGFQFGTGSPLSEAQAPLHLAPPILPICTEGVRVHKMEKLPFREGLHASALWMKAAP